MKRSKLSSKDFIEHFDFEELETARLTNLTIKNLFTRKAKLTFLVGAGCSVDSPSCLPAGRAIMDAIIEYICAESEIEKIKNLEELRFEALVEILRDQVDPDLKIIEYYGLCNTPNLQHFFLAEMIKKGHFVMTTNFDFLIEHALGLSGVSDNDIIPVITREDFENFKNPSELAKQGKKPIYKVHGSTKNIITGENTKDYLIATIKGFGSNKEGLNVFRIEPFKRSLFDNISNERSLVVIGYSGSDDFDIIPTLMLLKGLVNIIWINYVKNDEGKEKIYKIQRDVLEFDKEDIDKLDKVNQILVEIKRAMPTIVKRKKILKYSSKDKKFLKQWLKIVHDRPVYRVDVNTPRLIKKLFKTKLEISSTNFKIDPRDWLRNNVKEPDEKYKLYIAYKIYSSFQKDSDSMACLKALQTIAKEMGDRSWEFLANNEIGGIHRLHGNYIETLKRYEEGLKIAEQSGNISWKATALNSMASHYFDHRNFDKAFEIFGEVIKIFRKLGDFSGIAIVLNNMAVIYRIKGNRSKALEQYEVALKIYEELGNLEGKAQLLNNIGKIYDEDEDLNLQAKAVDFFEEALKIADQLGSLRIKMVSLESLGDWTKSVDPLKNLKEALDIAKELGDIRAEAQITFRIAMHHLSFGEYNKTIEFLEDALELDRKTGDLMGEANSLWKLGKVHGEINAISEAQRFMVSALGIFKELGLKKEIQEVKADIKKYTS